MIKQSNLSEATEESPLSPGGKKAKSVRLGKSAERILDCIKRVFVTLQFGSSENRSQFDFANKDSRFNDDDDDDDDDDLGINTGCRNCCKITYKAIPLVVLIAVSYGIGKWNFFNVESGSCGDPIMALKDTSSIEGLQNAVVAADHELCSEVGNSILLAGGNAVDAAVSVSLCLGVANPASSGLGGGAFILIHSDRKNYEERSRSITFPDFHDARDNTTFGNSMSKMTEVIDCRETAPNAATQDMFASQPWYASSIGGLAVAVPGELRGLELAHARHGFLPWAKVVEPARKMARDGIPVSQHLAGDIKGTAERATKNQGEASTLRQLLTKHDDWRTSLKEGDVLRNPKLAETLQIIAEVGSDGFYKGNLAESLVKDVVSAGGILTADDMVNYKPTIRNPVVGDASGFTLVGVPPPSSGGATLIGAVRFLSGYKSPLASAKDTLSVHRTVEALRHVFAIRMSLSDPAYNANKTRSAVEDLISGQYIEYLRNLTMDNSTLPLSSYGGKKWGQLHDSDANTKIQDAHEGDRRLRRRRLARPFGYLEDSGTSHLSIVDKDGNAVAITSSVNEIFGSRVFSKSTGVLLGNTMDDFGNPGGSNFFGLKPSRENFIAPGKKVSWKTSRLIHFRRVTSLFALFISLCRQCLPLWSSATRKILSLGMILETLSLWSEQVVDQKSSPQFCRSF